MTLRDILDKLLNRQPASASTAVNGCSWCSPTTAVI